MTALSPRQREIVVLAGRDGKQWATVARELEIHPSTLRNHVNRILARCGIDRAPREAMVEVYYRYVVSGDHAANGQGRKDHF